MLGTPRSPPAWASPGTPDKSELQALCCLPSTPAPLGAWVGGLEPQALLCSACIAPLCSTVPGSAGTMGKGAAAVLPPPACPLSGSRVSSRAGFCRPLALGSYFFLQLPAALAAPQPGNQLSGTARPKLAQEVGGWWVPGGRTWARVYGNGGSLSLACCCDGPGVQALAGCSSQLPLCRGAQLWVACALRVLGSMAVCRAALGSPPHHGPSQGYWGHARSLHTQPCSPLCHGGQKQTKTAH